MEKRVQEMDDIQAHLDEMALSYECLSGMGVILHDEDYVSMVLMSFPKTYSMHLKTLTDFENSSSHKFITHDFIIKVTELFDKWQLRANCDNKHALKDSALQSTKHKKSGKKSQTSKDIECFNCHKKGHFSHNCHGSGGAKEGQLLPKKQLSKSKDNTANAVTNVQDCALSAVILRLGTTDLHFDNIYLDKISLEDIVSDNDVPPTLAPELEASALPAFTVSTAISHASELYDSGATCHMIVTNHSTDS